MELRHLRYFVSVAESCSFTRAAAALRVAQPALSRQVHDLEEELGVRLLDRSPRGLRLTEAGEAFLVDARGLLAQSEQAVSRVRRFASSSMGRMSIAYAVGLFHSLIPALVAHIRRECPELEVELLDLDAARQVELLLEGKLDIGLLGFLPPMDLRDVLEAHPIMSCTFVVALPERHPLADRPILELGDLAGEAFVSIREKPHPGAFHYATQLCLEAGFRPRVVMTGDRGQVLLNAISCGKGVALAPDLTKALPHPGVVFRPLAGVQPVELCAVWRKGAAHPEILSFKHPG